MTSSLLDSARAGDGRAFGELIAPYIRELHLHCYRMLGSVSDSEDLLQETLTAAWSGLDGFAGRASLRAWLYRIATNRCLNALRDGKRRAPAEPVPPFQPPDPSRRSETEWLQPCPESLTGRVADPAPCPAAQFESLETVELAFIVALQLLPPRQTAAVILADVLDFSVTEIAAVLECTTTSVKGILQRGRASLARRRSGPAHAPSGGRGSAVEAGLAQRFAASFVAGDVAGVVALLTEDAWLAMPPASHEYRGPGAIAGFLRVSLDWRGPRRMMLVPARANGQPAFGCYLSNPGGGPGYCTGVIVLTMQHDRISRITRFLDERLHRYFGLPDAVPDVAPHGLPGAVQDTVPDGLPRIVAPAI